MKKVHRNQKVCQECGDLYYGSSEKHYCQACAEKIKAESTMRLRKCTDCGREFLGGPRAKRCPECRIEAARINNKKYKKTGTMRPIGSIDKCEWCGEEYSITSGRQKYCSKDCQHQAVLKWQRAHKKECCQDSEKRAKRQRANDIQEKVCPYCLGRFHSATSRAYCSEYCKREQQKIIQCKADILRGQRRNLKKYEDAREVYRSMQLNET